MLQFVIALVVVGGVLYFLPRAPLDATIKDIIKVVLVVALIIWGIKLLWPLTGL